MGKVLAAGVLLYLVLIALARGQTDDPFAGFPLMMPQLGSEFGQDKRPPILDENLLEWTFEKSDYHLIDPNKLEEVFKAHPDQFAQEFDVELKRIKTAAQLHDYAVADAQRTLMLINLLRPNMATRLASMLKYLNISIDEFNAFTEEKRKSEFCRYRVAIYRQNGIMYPKECWH